ncbi:hypothetical protein GOC74_16135 [Halomicrobium mukohataei]|uniref:Uncharacterized protein n=1 Tax=Halomicrobium mukohataei TaxID=57705 RepID=A0A847UK00_9EURY|nr:hypothetical protein [Halomicrobium mukohataei]NLV11458.1 hypothetical protein [Halomicrobium mukohataei]
MEQRRRTLLAGVACFLGGCVSPVSTPDTTDTAPPTATEIPSTPAHATCHPDAIRTPPSGGYPTPPSDLTTERVTEYVTTLERAVMLPPKDERTDGHLALGSPSVETVPEGYLAYVPVHGGYYNMKQADSTVTQHADLARYTASYFLNSHVVRRMDDTDRADPRTAGTVIVCDPE